MSDYTDHLRDERNAQRALVLALVLALAYPLGLLLLVLALFVWGAL